LVTRTGLNLHVSRQDADLEILNLKGLNTCRMTQRNDVCGTEWLMAEVRLEVEATATRLEMECRAVEAKVGARRLNVPNMCPYCSQYVTSMCGALSA
jgi:hypothetical protein